MEEDAFAKYSKGTCEMRIQQRFRAVRCESRRRACVRR
jgi:hypothetical protein